MLRSGWFLMLALVVSGFVVPARLQAAEPKVSDQGGFFSASAIAQATQKLQDIKRRFKVEVVIETFPSIPESMKAQYNPDQRPKFFRHWAETRATDEGLKGIYVLLCKSPGHLQIEADESVRRKAFRLEDRDELVAKALNLMKKQQFDAALLAIASGIESTVQTNLGQRAGGATAPVQRPPNGVPLGQAHSSSLMGWACFAVAVFIGIWLVRAIFRAFSGGGRGYGGMAGGGPGGMGGGYGQPGYGGGGGGGGFMSSLLGGMFGAAAGNWLYDSFRGGGQGSSSGNTSSQQGGYDSSDQGALPADQPGAGVFGGDNDDAGGGDFGGDDSTSSGGGGFDDGGGGDFGGGGGDFGGGGGGDFGGGGGDFGG